MEDVRVLRELYSDEKLIETIRTRKNLHFFSDQMFNNDAILSLISADKVFLSSMGAIHCEVESIQISFLYYAVPLIYPCIFWNGIKIAQGNIKSFFIKNLNVFENELRE